MILHKVLTIVSVIWFSNTCKAQSNVSLTINNFKNNKGVCQVCLFDSPVAFKGNTGKPVACKKIKIEHKKANVVFESVQPGTYAVMTFHDANSNNKMDTNFLGIPTEGYGASRNNLPFAAAPTFHANKFFVAPHSSLHLLVKLRNL